MEKFDVKEAYQTIEEGVVGAYRKIEDSAVSGYQKVEDGAVSASERFPIGLFRSSSLGREKPWRKPESVCAENKPYLTVVKNVFTDKKRGPPGLSFLRIIPMQTWRKWNLFLTYALEKRIIKTI